MQPPGRWWWWCAEEDQRHATLQLSPCALSHVLVSLAASFTTYAVSLEHTRTHPSLANLHEFL